MIRELTESLAREATLSLDRGILWVNLGGAATPLACFAGLAPTVAFLLVQFKG